MNPATDDPAFQPPSDPLVEGTGSQRRVKMRPGAVYRDIPIVTSATYWNAPLVRAALRDLVLGLFDVPAQLIDSMYGDSRVQSGLVARVGGLLGRKIQFRVPKKYRDSAAGKECAEAFSEAWPIMAAESVLGEVQRWAVMLGHGHAQLLWDVTSGPYAVPHPRIWHPRYTYFDWTLRSIVAITQDGALPIEAGTGEWLLHAPHGVYRGWMRGSARACAPWWLARNYALRDASRWSEVHGLPMVKLKHPASADPTAVERFRVTMANRGGETCVDLPQGLPEGTGGTGDNANFDVEYLEAKASEAFNGFKALIAMCNEEITLTLQAEAITATLPSGGGSYAAAKVGQDVKQALLEADARALERTLYRDLARPFAAFNFGEPDLASEVVIDITPYEDFETKAKTAALVAQIAVSLANAGYKLKDFAAFARRVCGVDFGELLEVEPRIGAAGGGAGLRIGQDEERRRARIATERRRIVDPAEVEQSAVDDLLAAFEAGARRRTMRR